MKTIFPSLIIVLTFLNPFHAVAKDFSFDVPYLTQEEFVSLYEADQRAYVILLRQAAADLSYEDQLSFFQRFNFQAPVWAAIFANQAVSAESETPSEAAVLAQIAEAEKKASWAIEYLKKPKPTFWNRALFTVNLGARPEPDFYTGHEDDPHYSRKRIIIDAYKARNEAVAMISRTEPGPEQDRMVARLRSSWPTFNNLRIGARAMSDNKVWRETVEDYDRQYYSIFPQVKRQRELQAGPLSRLRGRSAAAPVTVLPPVVVRASKPANAGVLHTVLNEERSCVRCIYGGFVISNNEKCEAVSHSAVMLKQLAPGPIRFPAGVDSTDMNCQSPKAVMCNPLLFGLKSNGPLCVGKSSSATRTCTAAAGTSEDSISSTAEMISLNRPAFNAFTAKLGNICKKTGLQCSSETRRNDIRSTCTEIRKKALAFRDTMRQRAAEIRASRPSAAPQPAAPVGTDN